MSKPVVHFVTRTVFHGQRSFDYAYCQRPPKSVTWSVPGVTCKACLRALGFFDAKPYPKERK